MIVNLVYLLCYDIYYDMMIDKYS